jgi:hypothetical protein
MKNKQYFIKQLCKLRNLDPDSEEAKSMEDMKVVELLIAIKEASQDKSVPGKTEHVVEDDDFSSRAGCRF